MIIYGTNARLLKSVQLTHEKCPNCGTEGSLLLSVYNRYAHIFWIPFFPIPRTGGIQCASCGQVVKVKDMSPALKTHYTQVEAQTKLPLYNWSAMGILIVLIGWFSYQSGVDKENEQKYLSAPLRGDVYHYKTTEGFSIMKVSEVAEDSLLIQFNQYWVDQRSGTSQLQLKEFDEAVWVQRDYIKMMYDSADIFAVER